MKRKLNLIILCYSINLCYIILNNYKNPIRIYLRLHCINVINNYYCLLLQKSLSVVWCVVLCLLIFFCFVCAYMYVCVCVCMRGSVFLPYYMYDNITINNKAKDSYRSFRFVLWFFFYFVRFLGFFAMSFVLSLCVLFDYYLNCLRVSACEFLCFVFCLCVRV